MYQYRYDFTLYGFDRVAYINADSFNEAHIEFAKLYPDAVHRTCCMWR